MRRPGKRWKSEIVPNVVFRPRKTFVVKCRTKMATSQSRVEKLLCPQPFGEQAIIHDVSVFAFVEEFVL